MDCSSSLLNLANVNFAIVSVASLAYSLVLATTVSHGSKMLTITLAIDHIHSRIVTIVRVEISLVIPTHHSLSLSSSLIIDNSTTQTLGCQMDFFLAML
jgi:hypothetical protein